MGVDDSVRAPRFVGATELSLSRTSSHSRRERLTKMQSRSPCSPIPNSSDILQAVIDATPDAIFVKDLDGRYVLVNDAAARFVGRPPPGCRSARTTSSSIRKKPRAASWKTTRSARQRHGDVVRGRGDERGRHAGLPGHQGRLPRQRRPDPRHLRHLARHHRAAHGARLARADAGRRCSDRRRWKPSAS